MQQFYTNLQGGMEKDEALRQAKLDYLDTAERKAPFFWAGFIPSGNMQSITLDHGNEKSLLIIAGLSFVLLIFGIILKYCR